MTNEFGQIESKLAEYGMAREQLGKIDYDEKIDQIKKQLKYELMIEFLKVDDLLVRQGTGWNEKRTHLANLYYDQVDPDRSYSFGLRCQILEDSQRMYDIFWNSSERIVNKLNWQSMEELTEIMWRKEEKSGNINFEKFLFMPPPDPSRRNQVVKTVREKLNIPVVLPDNLTKTQAEWRPSYAYPLGFEYTIMKRAGSANNNRVGMAELQSYMYENDLCGLTLDEYLFLLADPDFMVDGDLTATLIDETLEAFEDYRLESYNYKDELTFRIVDSWESKKTIFALNGWQWEIK